jgi:hypothetical protein
MSIAFADVFPVLAEALPDFRPSPQELEECLSYVFLSDMVRFVCDRSCSGFPEYEILMYQFANLLERLIVEGDSDVHDLAHDALDSVWEREEYGEREVLAHHFGPMTRELWERICAGEHGQ